MSSYRTVLIAGAVGLALAWPGPRSLAPAAHEPSVQRLRVVVTETAGIRRFGYPVSTVLQLPEPVADHGPRPAVAAGAGSGRDGLSSAGGK